MEIIWQGKDITQHVQVERLTAWDRCGARCDGLELDFYRADAWYKWGPEKNDSILVKHRGWDTGIMYLHTIAPKEDHYKVMATALPCSARKIESRSWEGKTIEEIFRGCGKSTGMGSKIFGIEGNTVIPYIMQDGESAAAFLNRLATWEGAKLKCVNGKYTAIGIDYAQGIKSKQKLKVCTNHRQTDYRDAEYVNAGGKLRKLTIKSAFAEATATDTAAGKDCPEITVDLPVSNQIQAARWARGLLKAHNRMQETLTIDKNEFNPGWAAMIRIDITGGTDADGEWIIEEVEHDIKNDASRATLHRCITSVR